MREILLALALLLPGSAFAATHYVWCGATGAATGNDFTNAKTDLPTSLVRGDVYVVAGSNSCTYAAHNFDDAVSTTLVITVRKAAAATDSGVAGWQAGFATAPAIWTMTDKSDPESGTVPLWKICSNYYTIEGITGTIDPQSGGPSSFGFVVKSKNFFVIGLVAITNNSCSSGVTAHSNITIKHTEISGVDPYRSAATQAGSCSWAANVTTVTLSPAPSWTPVVGDAVDANTAVQGGTVIAGSNNVAVTDVSTWPTVKFASTSSPCASIGSVSLNFGGSTTYYQFNVGDTYSNILISDTYMHDMAGSPIASSGCTASCVYTHNYFARNRYTPTQHANGIDSHPSSTTPDDNVTVSYNYFVDMQGTAFLNVLQGALPVGHSNNWDVYGNLFWLTDNTANIISQGFTCSNGNTCDNWRIFNNTFYNITNASSSSRIMCNNGGVFNARVFNNMWVNTINQAPTMADCSGTLTFDQNAAGCGTTGICEDYSYFDGNTNAVGSDVHAQSTAIAPSALWVNPSLGNFNLQAHTNNMFNTHALLAGNDLDLAGTSRCVGISCPSTSTNWDAGALQFPEGGSIKPTIPAPPSGLVAIPR